MRNREAHRPAWLIFAALLGVARAGTAQDDSVRVTCDALTPDDAAQVEARTRATLLTTADGNLSVRIECAADTATVRAVAGERTESTVLTLPGENPREALLAAVERTLAALERPGTGTGTGTGTGAGQPLPTSAVPAASAGAAVATPPRPAPAPPVTKVAVPERRAPAWEVGAGALAEVWQGTIGYGARLVVERRWAPWSVGAAFGWLTAPGQDAFRANEFHALALGALEEERVTGIRGSLGAGISVLTVAPDPELVARSSTTLALVYLELGVARPVRFGRGWFLPAAGLRLFPGRREVIVDATRRLVLPPVCPSLFLGFGYEI
jgi:hypothetical protein